VTDRPDFTESGVVVPRGSLQLEGGLTWDRFEDDSRSLTAPELLVRWGVGDRVELRFELPGYLDQSPGNDGWSDGAIGVKVQLGPVGDWDVALLAMASVPVGDDELTSDEPDPMLILTAGRDLTADWSFGSQLSASWATEDGDRELTWEGTIVLGRSISDRTGAFFELAADLPESGTSAVLVHHGYTWLPAPQVQLDLHAAAGLTDAAPELLIGAGVTARF
jgi:hypothetical protein